jgi:glucan phosphoethanolaminetransferase (alkaline phosphatase superfamily)
MLELLAARLIPMRELLSLYFLPILAIWGIFYIFVIWVLWMIVRSLKGIDASLKEIASKSHTHTS